MGRPRVEIDWEEFEKLCQIQCTAEEVAFWFNCSVDTIERNVRRRYKSTFAEIFAQKSVRGKVALRRTLFQIALKGNLGALIWLSKNHLNMSEKVRTEHSGFIEEKAPPKSVTELRQELDEALGKLKSLDE